MLSICRLYTLKQLSSHEIAYRVHRATSDHQAALVDFFRLETDTSLAAMLSQWSECDPVFKRNSSRCKGVRLLRVDPFEALISFVCSANNNISRITSIVHSLCSEFGEHLVTIDDRHYHAFPTLEALQRKDCEAILGTLGFGYRAKYVRQCVHQVAERGGKQWLQSLKKCPYEGKL